MSKMSREALIFFARLAVSIAVLALLFRLIGWNEILQVARNADLNWVLLTWVASLCGMAMNAALLRHLLGHVGLDVKFTRVLLANSLSVLYSLILPGDMLAGAAKWVDLSAATGDKSRVLSAMVFAKIGLALSPLAIGSVALAFQNPYGTRAISLAAIATSAAVIIGMTLYLNARTGALIDQAVEIPLRLLPNAAASHAQSVSSAFSEYRSLRATDGALVLLYSVAAFVLGVIATAFAATAVGADVPVLVFAWVSMILFITRLFPITISNLGIREGVMIAVLGLYGVGPATAFAAGIVIFSSHIFVALAGAIYQITIAAGWVKWRGL